MSALNRILTAPTKKRARIILCEGEDKRVVTGALKAAQTDLAEIILVGNAENVYAELKAAGDNAGIVKVMDPQSDEKTGVLASAFFKLRKHKGVSQEEAKRAVLDPLTYSALMVHTGAADGTVGGAVYSTRDTVKTAFQIIGKAENVNSVSSYFLMAREDTDDVYAFADCALTIEPSPEELAQIAIETAKNFQNLTKKAAKVAMLSFSTLGSGKHARVDIVNAATKRAQESAPELCISGELQFDAAIDLGVAKKKAPDDPVAGSANVFVFPNLEAGNIGYKIAQRLGGLRAIGPILQGLAKPANDLSRGCSADDVFDMICLTAQQAAGGSKNT